MNNKVKVSHFIKASIVRQKYPNNHMLQVAWVVASTPPNLTQSMKEKGYIAPPTPSFKEIFKAKKRVAAEMYLTRTCGLNCIGCSVPTYIRWAKEEKKTYDEWKNLIKKLKNNGLKAVKFIGGEVGTIPWLPNIVADSLKEGLSTSVFTDGVPYMIMPKKLDELYQMTKGRVILHTSTDFLPPEKKLPPSAATDIKLSRHYKAQESFLFIQKAVKMGFPVIAHMMVYKENAHLISRIYKAVIAKGARFSIGTMQSKCHIYQGRGPNNYLSALTGKERFLIKTQIKQLIKTEELNMSRKKRAIVNSKAHLATLDTEGINPTVGCNNKLGPPTVFAVMPDHTFRHCTVIQTLKQVKKCPGCSYGVFRDGDPEWAKLLLKKKKYAFQESMVDFPSIIYPSKENNYLKGIYYEE